MKRYGIGLLWALFIAAGCAVPVGYRYLAGPVRSVSEEGQAEGVVVMDDGTVKHAIGRLEIALKPMTDEELNRQFSSATKEGLNPYTYGTWRPMGEMDTPDRFTVFHLRVKNYEFPKMEVDPSKVEITTSNGRKYTPFSLLELDNYFSRYAAGYAGNPYKGFKQRMDILKRTSYQKDVVFSGQEREGYLVFPPFPPDVTDFNVQLSGIVLRFDHRNEAMETVDQSFHFEREVRLEHARGVTALP
ncbi:MAG: hypothetical protein V1800_07895 [Candidatus Latescibacterota bacterium]